MATFSTSATTLAYASASKWTTGKTRQGVYTGTRYEGAIPFGGLSGMSFNNIDITQITMQMTFTSSGGAGSKYLTMYKATGNTITGSIGALRGASIGAVSVYNAYNATRTVTFNASTNAAIFNTLKAYFSGGNRILIIYVPTTRSSLGDYCADYLTISAMTLTLTYAQTQSKGSLESASVDAGTWQKLNITAYNAEYTHKVIWRFGEYIMTQELPAGANYAQYTIPLSWMTAIPAATSGQATATLETYGTNGSLLGSSDYPFTITVPTSVKPTLSSVSVSPVNTNPKLAEWGIYAVGKSQASIIISGANGAYGSTITSYSITTDPNVASGTGSSLITPMLFRSGKITVTATVTDSRGRTATASTSFSVYQYDPPSFTKLECFRCTSTGTRDDASGTYAYIRATFTCSELTVSNSVTCSLRFYQQGGSYATTKSLSSGVAVILGDGTLAADAAYGAEFTLRDTLGTETYFSSVVNSAAYIIHIKRGGGAIGFGMAAGADETVSFGWALKLTKPLEITQGGTGATSAAGARNALGLGNTAGALPIANGGTGATTVAGARNALGLGNTDGALPIANGGTGATTVEGAREALGLNNIVDLVYPIGSIYMSVNSTSPAQLFGGTWEAISDRFLLAAGTTYKAGATGGAASQSIAAHTHRSPAARNGNYVGFTTTGASSASGNIKNIYYASGKSGGAYNGVTVYNTGSAGAATVQTMPPYLAVYVWKRTA